MDAFALTGALSMACRRPETISGGMTICNIPIAGLASSLRPHSPWLEDYQIFQTTRDEYVIGEIRRGLEAAGVPVEEMVSVMVIRLK